VIVGLDLRLARHEDLPALMPLVDAAIVDNQRAYLSDAEIEASRALMGIDSQLIEDGTYFVVELDGAIAGCGGWSRRATPWGSDHSEGRDDTLLDPAVDAAKVRAMYTDPSFTRRGVGRRILAGCEEAAAAEGFTELELHATLSGHPLYLAYGFVDVEAITIDVGGTPVPAIKMHKSIS
jgi:GNAT superfamily N-acetyltransferase